MDGMKKLLMKLETNLSVTSDENAYIVAANGYLKANLKEKAEWAIISPELPGLCHEIISSIKLTVFPNGSKHSSSSTEQTRSTAAGVVSFLHGLFPILTWGRNY